jgi:two-component system, chemotaxis family, sensor kinase CheA
VLHDGEQVELLDPYWLFANHLDDAPGEGGPLCLIDAGDPWLGTFVRPLLERAGYRVATSAAPGEHAVAVLTTEPSTPSTAPAPVITLSSRAAAAGAIYRYDRAAILAAVAAHAGARA